MAGQGPYSSDVENSCWRVLRRLTGLLIGRSPRWNVEKLRGQLITDITLNFLIFFASEVAIASEAPYWRPIKWAIYWIVVAAISGFIGILGAYRRSSGMIAVFLCLQLMFSSINLAHVNQMRGEMIRTCNLAQISFKDCDPAYNSLANTHLSSCIYTNTCYREDLDKTDCKAVGKGHCQNTDELGGLFWFNAMVNFLTYSEPTWFALLLLIRLELPRLVGVSAETLKCEHPEDDPLDEEEYPNPGIPWVIFKCQEDGDDAEITRDRAADPLLGSAAPKQDRDFE